MQVRIKLDAFEGPLDLLLHLLEKNKVDIYDIPIADITDQYLEILHAARTPDLDGMSDFLVMAATLLDIKARMLLPAPENGDEEAEDPRTELVEQLLQYKMYKYMSYELKDRQLDARKMTFKSPSLPAEVAQYEEPVDLNELTADLDLEKLHAVFESLIRRQSDKIDPIRSRFGTIEKEEISLEERVSSLRSYAAAHRAFSFGSLFDEKPDRMETVVTFLAVLELMKTGEITVSQERLFDDIRITSNTAAQSAIRQEQ